MKVFLFLIASLFLLASAAGFHLDNFDDAKQYWPENHPYATKREFGTFSEAAHEWSYDGDNEYGPSRWSLLAPACGGSFQSPIDVHTPNVYFDSNLQPLRFNYSPWTNRTVVNTGHALQVNQNPGDKTSTLSGGALGDQVYYAAQFHFHAVGEHTVNGGSYPLEMHIVHINTDPTQTSADAPTKKELTVVGLLFREGRPNEALQPFIDSVNRAGFDVEGELAYANLNLDAFLPEDTTYYTYPGSLTTPKCRETVTWHLLRAVQEVSRAQLDILRRASSVKYNNRPTQRINSRQVRTNSPQYKPLLNDPQSQSNSQSMQNGGTTININFANLLNGFTRN